MLSINLYHQYFNIIDIRGFIQLDINSILPFFGFLPEISVYVVLDDSDESFETGLELSWNFCYHTDLLLSRFYQPYRTHYSSWRK